jgi:hypothetical protein
MSKLQPTADDLQEMFDPQKEARHMDYADVVATIHAMRESEPDEFCEKYDLSGLSDADIATTIQQA